MSTYFFFYKNWKRLDKKGEYLNVYNSLINIDPASFSSRIVLNKNEWLLLNNAFDAHFPFY